MSTVKFRRGTLEDALSLAPNLRPEDVEEVSLSHGVPPEVSLSESVVASKECFTAYEGDTILAMGGFALSPCGSFGMPWLVGTPEMVKHPKVLVEEATIRVRLWGLQVPLLMNYSHVRNTVHHRWLKRIGFTLQPTPVPYGPSQAPFIFFYRYS